MPIALNSNNCSEFIIAMWACTKLGAILVPINPLLKKLEVSHILRNCEDIKIAIVHEKNFALFKRASKEFELEKIILIRKGSKRKRKKYSLC
ncbi:MAG: AMP-binding protein [Candidatus Helarchaeota archaeon]